MTTGITTPVETEEHGGSVEGGGGESGGAGASGDWDDD